VAATDALGGGAAACGFDELKDGPDEPEQPAASQRTTNDAPKTVIARPRVRTPPRPLNTA